MIFPKSLPKEIADLESILSLKVVDIMEFSNSQKVDWERALELFEPGKSFNFGGLMLTSDSNPPDDTIVCLSQNLTDKMISVPSHYHDFYEDIIPFGAKLKDNISGKEFSSFTTFPPATVHQVDVPPGASYVLILRKA